MQTQLGPAVQRVGSRADWQVHLASTSQTLCESLQRLIGQIGLSGFAASRVEYHPLADEHGCLEPLQALHQTMLAQGHKLFVYANAHGAVRAVLLHPIRSS